MQTENSRGGRPVADEADLTSRCRCINKPRTYMIFPRANRVEHHLPGFNQGVLAQVLATPEHGAKFVEHELLVEINGSTDGPRDEVFEQFFFVLEGEIELSIAGSKPRKLVRGGFCWLPPHCSYEFSNQGEGLARLIWVRRRYEEVAGLSIPEPMVAHESDVPARPTDTYLEQHLTPYEQMGFDMGINLQVFEPGIYFSFVEAHVMEHGLYMLEGRGLYWLNRDLIEVEKDDFIYMAPYCPQFYYATGWTNSAYLLYKDVNRDYTQRL